MTVDRNTPHYFSILPIGSLVSFSAFLGKRDDFAGYLSFKNCTYSLSTLKYSVPDPVHWSFLAGYRFVKKNQAPFQTFN